MQFSRDDFEMICPENKVIIEDEGCKHNYIHIDGHYTCIICGEVDLIRPVFAEKLINFYRGYVHVYHRRSYFIERLNLLIGKKQSSSPNYIKAIEFFKNHKFKSVFELKRLMKKYRFGKLLKYVYTLYYDLTGNRLINLTENDILRLSNAFLEFEREFKHKYPDHKNILSYDMIIFHLLKKLGYNYRVIIQPKSHKKNLLKFIEICF